VKFPPELSARQQVVFAARKINELNRADTAAPFRVRQMTLQLRDLGDPIKVELPAQDVVSGSLYAVIPGRGRAPARKGATGAGAGASGSAAPAPAATTDPATSAPPTTAAP
jgi:hypothetical protein